MTEDDTFNALKKTPLRQMVGLIREHSSQLDSFFERHGWTNWKTFSIAWEEDILKRQREKNERINNDNGR